MKSGGPCITLRACFGGIGIGLHGPVSVLILLLLASTAHAWPARIVDVTDGDTITVEPAEGGNRIKVRLHGIDCPEKDQPGGEPARAFVHAVALYKLVDVQQTPQQRDHDGRTVAVVILPGGESIQAALLRAGHAWVWPRYCRGCDEWQGLQEEARKAGRGIWQQEPMPPWEWWKGGRRK